MRVAGYLAHSALRRVHYGWIVVAVMFTVILIGVGVRAAPSVLLVPLQQSFGWTTDTISGAVSLNILLLGLMGPFMTALMQRFGIKRTILCALILLLVGALGSALVSQVWQLYATWGLLIGLGSSATGFGGAALIANRWFVAKRGLVIGLLTASNASGQLVFLPVLAALAGSFGWVSVPLAISLALLALILIVAFLMVDRPESVGLTSYGGGQETAAPPVTGNPFAHAVEGLALGMRSVDFWLLAGTFAVCGFSTYGLIGTHMISYCMDHGISQVAAAGVLASLGVFDLVGTVASGWLSDRYNPRILLFWYYGLRGLALLVLPFTDFDALSLGIFALFYGLDWVATVPPTVMLTTQVFGKTDGPVIVSWVFCAHQLGGSLAAIGAGLVRTQTGSYTIAFLASGLACIMASLLVLQIARTPALAPAE